MSIRIKLVGCNRYSYGPKGEVFEKGYEYELEDDKARVLLHSQTDAGLPYFVRVERPASAEVETISEEVSGEGVGGVRILRKKAPKVTNPKVRTSGDSAPLRDTPEEAMAVHGGDDDGLEV